MCFSLYAFADIAIHIDHNSCGFLTFTEYVIYGVREHVLAFPQRTQSLGYTRLVANMQGLQYPGDTYS